MNAHTALLLLPGLIVGLTVHECAHAWSARLLGDHFASRQGRVSLNPLRHLSPLGTLAIFLLPIGWGRPVPVNLYNFRHPRRDYLLTSLAGPAANLLVVVLCLAAMQFTRHTYCLGPSSASGMELAHLMLTLVALINVNLAVLNLIPIPPLDGSKIWPCIIPQLKTTLGGKRQWIFVLILGLLLWTNSLGPAISNVTDAVLDWMPQSDAQRLSDKEDMAVMRKQHGELLRPTASPPATTQPGLQ